MTRTVLPILLYAAAALGLDNSVTIHDLSGAAQTNRPVTVSRFFARGEIPVCPQAYLNGSGLTTQADVKTRWDDGSVQHSIVSFAIGSLAANGSATVDFRNQAGCNNGGYLDQAAALAAAWDAEIVATANDVTHIVNARAVLSACGSISADMESSGCRYWLRGPLVTQVIVEDKANRVFDFGWEYDPVTSWKAPTQAKFNSLHPVFVVTIYPNVPSAGQSAVRVDYILENTWTDRLQTQNYSFELWGGSPLVSKYSPPTPWNHPPKTRWRIVRWVANQPGDVFVDYNLRYMIHSRAIPPYDTSLRLAPTAPTTELNAWASRNVNGEPALCDPAAATCIYWIKFIPQTGGRKDIGPIPGWYVQYLYAMGDSAFSLSIRQQMWERFLIGQAHAIGGAGFHYREHLADRCYVRPEGSSTSKFFSSGGCAVNAQGKALSINARPTLQTRRGGLAETTLSVTDADDRLAYACTSTTDPCQVPSVDTTTANKWNWETDGSTAHLPGWLYLPYLITGEWYLLEEMWFDSSFWLSMQPPKLSSTTNARLDSAGLLWRHDQARMIWSRRNLAHAALMSPDASPEKEYFTQKLKNNIAAWEGAMGCTTSDGCVYQTDPLRGTYWTHGRTVWIANKANPLKFGDFRLGVCDAGINAGLVFNACLGEATWQANYTVMVHSMIAEIFPFAKPVAVDQLKNVIARYTDTGFNPVLGAEFHAPIMGADASTYLTTFASTLPWLASSCTLTAAVTTSDTTLLCNSNSQMNLPGGIVMRAGNELVRTSLSIGTTTTNASGAVCGAGGCNFSIPVSRAWGGTAAQSHAAGAVLTITYHDYAAGRKSDPTGGYPVIWTAASAWATGITRVRRPWDWARANQPFRLAATHVNGSSEHNPQWAFVPRQEIESLVLIPGSAQTLFRWAAPAEETCWIEVQSSAFTNSSNAAGVAVAAGTVEREFVASGLLAESLYYYRITCGLARNAGTFTTVPAGGGTVPLALTLHAPTSLSVVDVVVEHGSTTAYGTTEPAQSCSTSCTVNLTVPQSAARYLRWRWRRAGGVSVGQYGTMTIVGN